MIQRYLYGGAIALIFLLFLTAANYYRMLGNVRADRDLYLGQIIAARDSLRLFVDTDSSSVGAEFGMPGEDEINDALDEIDIPETIDPDEIDSYMEVTYVPPSDSLSGVSIGNRMNGGIEHLFDVGLRTQEFIGRIFVRNDSLDYDFRFEPVPQRIKILTRRVGVNYERIAFVPGRLTGLSSFDRAVPTQKTPERRLKWKIRGSAMTSSLTTDVYGVEVGPVWNLWRFEVGAGPALYGSLQGGQQTIGFWAAATLTL